MMRKSIQVVALTLLAIPATAVEAQVGGEVRSAVDSLLWQTWNAASAGADAGIRCLDNLQVGPDTRPGPGCEEMRVRFVQVDSLVERGNPEGVMYWEANLRSVWITAEQERRRLEPGGS